MNYLDYGIILAYLAAMLLLGYYFRDNDSKKDYFLGDGKIGWFAIGLSVIATQLSAVSFISIPAFVGAREGGGMIWVGTEMHAPLTMLVLMVLILPPLLRAGVISIYSFLEMRLGQSVRRFVELIFLFNRTVATGIMVYTVCLMLESIVAIPFHYSLLLMGTVTVVYSMQGGMRAVIYGDAAQMVILFLGIFVCIYCAVAELGGVSNWLAQIEPARAKAVDTASLGIGDGEFGFWPLMIGGLFISVAYYGTDQSEAQRLLASRDTKVLRRSLLFVGMIRYPIMALYALLGLAVGAVVMAQTDLAAEVAINVDRMMPLFMANYLPNGVKGLIVVAILAAAMSSLSSAVNSLAAVTVQGLKRFNSRNTNEEGSGVNYSRLVALFWGLVILAIAATVTTVNETLIVVISQIGSISFGPVLAVFVVAILLPKASSANAIVGLVAGLGLNIFLWLVVGDDLFWIWWNVTGFVMAFVVSYLLSLSNPEDNSRQRLDLKPDWAALRSRPALLLIVWFVLMLLLTWAWPYILGQ